jgi:KDO2-lipid IV(A) lauroyltransferase
LIALGEAVGVLAYLLHVRRAVALDGLRRAFPDKPEAERRRLARSSYAQLGRSLAEVLLVRRLPEQRLADLVRYQGWHIYEEALAHGRGVVCAIGHYGNFELLARAVARRGVRVTLIARGLRDAFGRWLVEDRGGAGVAHLPDKDATAGALAALRAGGVLAVAVDQNMRPRRGIFVDFFGTPACTTPAAAVYALRAGAPILAAFPVRGADGRHVVRILGPFTTDKRGHAAVQELTSRITAAVEDMVRERPDHWFWVHRRWKTRPGSAER